MNFYLVPGKTIEKAESGLPGKKLVLKSKDDFLEISGKNLEILEKNIPYLKSVGTVVDDDGMKKLKNAKEAEKPSSGKSEKRLSLEIEAEALEIEFSDSMTQKELSALIEEKKLELKTDPSGDVK